MTRKDLVDRIFSSKSFLCIGLDPDLDRLPSHLLASEDPVFEFNRRIIDATHDLCVAYKPNVAFYEALGAAGWRSLEKTLAYIPEGHLKIADAKRGDIGNTSALYAKAFFETLGADALTVAPYMGADSVKPFLNYPDKWVVLLALTSNPGSADFQLQPLLHDGLLFEKVIETAVGWASPDQLMFVVGATHPQQLERIRRAAPDHFLLIPGVGAQGGDLDSVCQKAMTDEVGILVNASRSIIYAGNGSDFDLAARQAALQLRNQMASHLEKVLS